MALYRMDVDKNAPPFHFRWKTHVPSLRWTTHRSMSSTFLVLLIIRPLLAAHNPATTSCLSIQANCVQRRGCATALHHYLLSCAYLINGQTTNDDDQCSVRCQRALVTLVSATTEEPPTRHQRMTWSPYSSSTAPPPTQHHHPGGGGWPPLPSFMSCSCGESALCRSQRSRLDCCIDGVTTALRAIADEETSVSCSLAEQICRADTSCLTAIEFYGRNCAYLLQQAGGGGSGGGSGGGNGGGSGGGGGGGGDRCLARCRNSVRVLYRQRQATKLRSCECDGSEDYDCRMLQSRTQQLCVDGERVSRGSTKRLTPRQKFKHRRNMTTFQLDASPDFTSDGIPLPPPRKRHGSANSGSKSVTRGIQNESLLICLLMMLDL